MIDYWSSVLPPGFEWPNGQTLASAATNYPEYNSWMGSGATPDLRGTTGVVLDNLGGAARGLLSHGYITGSALGAFGGQDYSQLGTANLPAYTPTGGVGVTVNDGPITVSGASNYAYLGTSGGGVGGGGAFGVGGYNAITATQSGTTASAAFTGNPQGGSSSLFSGLQPSTMIGKLLVVE